MEETSKPRGTPSKYKKEFSERAYELALLGATDTQIADELGVSKDTINEWKKSKKEFSDSLRRGKLQADGKVAKALYKRALGFRYNEVTYEKIGVHEDLTATSDRKMMVDVYRKKVVTKYVVPDTGAITLWLKNRQKDIWRDKQVVEFDHMTDDQLDKAIEELKKAAYEQNDEK